MHNLQFAGFPNDDFTRFSQEMGRLIAGMETFLTRIIWWIWQVLCQCRDSKQFPQVHQCPFRHVRLYSGKVALSNQLLSVLCAIAREPSKWLKSRRRVRRKWTLKKKKPQCRQAHDCRLPICGCAFVDYMYVANRYKGISVRVSWTFSYHSSDPLV